LVRWLQGGTGSGKRLDIAQRITAIGAVAPQRPIALKALAIGIIANV
jgi:hypothetical protein